MMRFTSGRTSDTAEHSFHVPQSTNAKNEIESESCLCVCEARGGCGTSENTETYTVSPVLYTSICFVVSFVLILKSCARQSQWCNNLLRLRWKARDGGRARADDNAVFVWQSAVAHTFFVRRGYSTLCEHCPRYETVLRGVVFSPSTEKQ